jgi:hypothetical protein
MRAVPIRRVRYILYVGKLKKWDIPVFSHDARKYRRVYIRCTVYGSGQSSRVTERLVRLRAPSLGVNPVWIVRSKAYRLRYGRQCRCGGLGGLV